MTIARVGSPQLSGVLTGGAPSYSVTGTNVGDGAVIGVWWSGTNALNSISLTGETVTLIGSPLYYAQIDTSLQLAYVKSFSGTGSKTLAGSFSLGVSAAFSFQEYSAQDSAAFYDGVEGGATSSVTGTNANVSLATASDHDLIVALIANDAGAGGSPGSGYNSLGTIGNVQWYDNGEDNVDVGVAGTYSVTWATPSSSHWMIKAAAFKPSGGGGSSFVPYNPNLQMAPILAM